jgi:DNA-binding NarL/FixJ family response regulator
MTGLRTVLCDDEELVLEALALAAPSFGLHVVGMTSDPHQVLPLVRELRPEVCVLDAHFPSASGPEIAVRMKKEVPATSTIMLTAHADAAVWAAYDDASLCGIVNKNLDFAAFRVAVLALSRGERVVAGWCRVPRQRAVPESESLTGRERDVLAALVRGAATRDIADQLDISTHTVRTHVQSLMRKLDVTTRAKATQVAITQRVLEAG